MRKRVKMSSLPHCLMHDDEDDALTDALNLSRFLGEFAYLMACSETDISGKAGEGLGLVAKLLQDKLEIAKGDYEFPFGAHLGGEELAARKAN